MRRGGRLVAAGAAEGDWRPRRPFARPLRRAGLLTATAALGHYLPSACVLGQWSPSWLRSLPAGLCRWRGPAEAREVALTFDDGPSAATTRATLDVLDDLGMRATFFVLGSLAESYPELVAEIIQRGHEIGCHGYRHEHHMLRTPGWIRRDLAAAVDALAGCGIRPRWFRPPYGQLTTRTVIEARRHAMEVALWSAWGREWAETDAEAVMARLTPGLEPGAIVVLHATEVDCPAGTAERTWRTLEMLAPILVEARLAAVPLGELLDGSEPGTMP